MKIAVECKSPLLQKSLELFLEEHLCSTKKCDIVVCDVKCLDDDKRCFCILQDANADLIKPFSKSQLIMALELKYKKLGKNEKDINESLENENSELDFSILEKRIEYLTQEYQKNVINAIKAFYEN